MAILRYVFFVKQAVNMTHARQLFCCADTGNIHSLNMYNFTVYFIAEKFTRQIQGIPLLQCRLAI